MDPLWTGLIAGAIALVILLSGMPIAFALGVTSLVELGLPVTLEDLDDALMATFAAAFGAPRDGR